MWRFFNRLIPADLGLTASQRSAVLKQAKQLYEQRRSVWFSGIIVFVWLHGMGWLGRTRIGGGLSEAEFYTVLTVGALLMGVVYACMMPALGARRAVFAALRARGHAVCPRCGYLRHGLGPEAPCPECGADTVSDSWERVTLNPFEAWRFRHIPAELGLSIDTRLAVMRRAWHAVRQDGVAFTVYAGCLSVVVSPFLLIWSGWAFAGYVAMVMVLYASLEWCWLRPCVRRELRALEPARP